MFPEASLMLLYPQGIKEDYVMRQASEKQACELHWPVHSPMSQALMLSRYFFY